MKKILLALLLGVLAAQPAPAQTGPVPYRLLNTIAIGGEGGWDYLTVDPAGGRLYVAHGSQVEVISLKTRQLIGTANTPGGHGIAVVPAAGRGYITCGRPNTCVVFDLETLKPVGMPIPTGPKPDALLYDAFSGRVLLFSNEGGNSTVLDGRTGAVVGTAALGGDAEAPAADGQGTIFVNIEDKGEAIAFDARTLAVRRRCSVAPAKSRPAWATTPLPTACLAVAPTSSW